MKITKRTFRFVLLLVGVIFLIQFNSCNNTTCDSGFSKQANLRSDNKKTCNSGRTKQKKSLSHKKQKSLDLALEFLDAWMIAGHYKGSSKSEKADFLKNCHEFPLEANYIKEKKIWHVFVIYGPNSYNMIFDERMEKGTIIFQSPIGITRTPDEIYDVAHPPLFTLEEFKKIVILPHNQ